MNNHFERAGLLLQQSRFAEAEKELKKELAENPENPYAFAYLSRCYTHFDKHAEAVSIAGKAVALKPDEAYLHFIQAHAFMYANRIKEAKQSASEALSLDPYFESAFEIKAVIALNEDKWEEALSFANQGLEIDPESVALVNLRANALLKLKRKEEAAETLDYALHKSPEDAWSHANKAWVAIENGKYDEAIEGFRLALKFNPNFEYARNGLKEAIRAKNVLYRGILKYFLWMDKQSQKNQWAVVIGAYVIYRILLSLLDKYPALGPILVPLIAAYVLFAFSTWIAKPISNIFLRFHPLGKYAMTDDEKKASSIVGVLFVASLVSIAAYFTIGEKSFGMNEGSILGESHSFQLVMLAIVFFLMMIPVSGMFKVDKRTQSRKYLKYYALGIAVVGLLGIFVAGVEDLFLVFALGILFYSFVMNYIVSREARRF